MFNRLVFTAYRQINRKRPTDRGTEPNSIGFISINNTIESGIIARRLKLGGGGYNNRESQQH